MSFDTRLYIAWMLTLMALAVVAAGLLPRQAAGALILVLAFSAMVVWLRGHVKRLADRS